METTTEVAALPSDALSHVFCRLPARSLAEARSVCKAWRAIVDARALLLRRRKLLPHNVHGVFVNYIDHCRPHLFSRPSPVASSASYDKINNMLGFLPTYNNGDWWSVLDHCRGLVLCDIEQGCQLCVCNPATQRWALVPPRWQARARWRSYVSAYLTFDPAMSPHYEVILIPTVLEWPQPEPPGLQKARNQRRAFEVRLHGVDDAPFCLDEWLHFSSDVDEEEEEEGLGDEDMELSHVEDTCHLTEWPPTPWTLDVFSSRVGRWEERAFVRQGEPAGTVQDMLLDQPKPTCRGPRQRYAAYWQGALYVHCRGSFIARLSLLNNNYQVIKTPGDIQKNTSAKPYLGISEKGVYFGIAQKCQLRVWILNESRGQMEWILKYEDDLTHYAQHVRQYDGQMDGPWIVHDVNDTDSVSEAMKQSSEWDSDSDDIFTIKAGSTDEEYYGAGYDILGFHPYKEVVFLADYFTVVAYHLKTSKVRYLGNSRPKSYYHSFTNDIYESFVYTPCVLMFERCHMWFIDIVSEFEC
ncbi:hypothetical protein SETIT_7G014300v2 [Setaria italica]|uniref:F-box domain-containing protein n=1 Tax=Setaria italica TaxID=4555 RepID=A0A368RSR0_SETIT|nr:hypothetical protein SETIT_7G014300v2 [Setaria italica]